jgi:N6-L-threonylcarbamoyladenine synthase
MLVLGIESSCDDACAAVVDEQKRILSHIRLGQTATHAPFGGVVPELAARDHLLQIPEAYRQAIRGAGISPSDLDYIAVTHTPGLMGSLMVGVSFAKGLALALDKPLIGVHHLMAHALTARLFEAIEFPYLCLLLSGGHSGLYVLQNAGMAESLGETLDDAAGEAFDKLAKLLNLAEKNGKIIEGLAAQGELGKVTFPVPLKNQTGFDFSFSGLKNAVRLYVAAHPPKTTQDNADICLGFQRAVTAHLLDRVEQVFKAYPHIKTLVTGGGVAANGFISQALRELAARYGVRLAAPPPAFCTDNAAMVAWCGVEWARLGKVADLSLAPLPRSPL